MRYPLAAAVAWLLLAATPALTSPIVGRPGTIFDMVVTSENTINSTGVEPTNPAPAAPAAGPEVAASSGYMQISWVNNVAGGSAVTAYITGSDTSGAAVFVDAGGNYYYPDAGNSTTPVQVPDSDIAIPLGGQGSTTTITLPGYLISARVWCAVGSLTFMTEVNGGGQTVLTEPSQTSSTDPSVDVNWGFVEMNYDEDSGVFGNISYVDFVGLVLGMMLLTGAGATQSVPGLNAGAVDAICAALQQQSASDGQPWGDMCVTDSSTGAYVRALSPQDYISINPDAFDSYYADYIDDVYAQFESAPLTVDTQAAAGNVTCTASGGVLSCAGDDRDYPAPAAADIFSCNSGPFTVLSSDNAVHAAVVPRLCAAFDRTTYLVAGGDVQPGPAPSEYYSTSPTNWYSYFVHQQEIDGIGYAFSYDDVTPNGVPSAAGTVSDGSPQVLTVVVGGPSSS